MPYERWLGKLTNLNKARGNAPHKPLLLLVFLELVENGDFAGGSLPLTPELAYRFDTFFNVVQHRCASRRANAVSSLEDSRILVSTHGFG